MDEGTNLPKLVLLRHSNSAYRPVFVAGLDGFRVSARSPVHVTVEFLTRAGLPLRSTLTYIGTLQIVCFRMLRESAVFFTLLSLMAIGKSRRFFLYGLSASGMPR